MQLWTPYCRLALVILLGLIGTGFTARGGDDRPAPPSGPAKPSEPFPLDLAFSHRRDFSSYERAAVSPDGARVAYGIVTPMKQRDDIWTFPSGLPVVFRGVRLQVAEISTGKTIALGAEGGDELGPGLVAGWFEAGVLLGRRWVAPNMDIRRGPGHVEAGD